MKVHEVNFDGLVGPTHNYAGLSEGNVASMTHGGAASNPRAAALQGLAKMKFLADRGLRQALLPPHARPAVEVLRRLGFGGSDAAVLAAAARQAPRLLAACCSGSGMWVANAATVSPSTDTADGRVHFTPANLAAKFHRSIEPPQTTRILRAVFRDPRYFVVHEPVPGGAALGDEGAANHTRLAPTHGHRGLHFFVYGYEASGSYRPRRFAARQAREASEAVVRRHGLAPGETVWARQAPAAIDAGVFHNDVIAVGNEQVLLYHERAFVDTLAVVARLRRSLGKMHPGQTLCPILIPEKQVPLRDAVKSYLFNSQLVTVAPGSMALIAPADCARVPRARAFLTGLIATGGTPVGEVHYLDLRQSMRNGGGPACLRLRVLLNDAELAAVPASCFINDRTYPRLVAWVTKHYRTRLVPADLADPALLEESNRALDELTQLLRLGPIYPFQRQGARGQVSPSQC